MPKLVISNRPNCSTDSNHPTKCIEVWTEWGKKYPNGILFTNDIKIIWATELEHFDFYLDTPNGIVALEDLFLPQWLSHFQVYDLYLRCKFDMHLKDYNDTSRTDSAGS